MSDRRGAVIVTGGAGFIGSHACKALDAAGWTPVTLDNLSTGHRDAVRWGPFEKVDMRDTEHVADAISRFEASAVLHFAASAYVGESVERPDAYYDNNVGGMLSLLKACVAAGVTRFVFSSSCATYGVPATVPIDEATPQSPINPYGRTKVMGEQMLADVARQHGISYALLRYFNAAGADPDGELAERHDPETHLLPLAVRAALGGPALRVFGSDYETPDGTCIRDYIHVTDLAHGHVAALDALADRPTLALNLGSGTGYSVLQIIEAVERHTGRAVRRELAPRRPGDPAMLVADPARARAVLGFECRHSDITTIVRTAARALESQEANASIA
ncbi:UDP-glucose 4-epimerase GalE [Rhodovulum sp. 12E13]|uniref:UDP-glucose 4-epimerase GalE n=1 Tax=Rhodovulum sp. 12E13 TaxID=2203891 RepID=UPI000E1AB99E|nr:UDP-glucose 4-epimerase GalE [Rhodovulum sp. 12E13]RDC75327.1 UDP-glucose 4-epimerase GalE [Rhodovulum sp. 12E13]